MPGVAKAKRPGLNELDVPEWAELAWADFFSVLFYRVFFFVSRRGEFENTTPRT
jgi:hypothetical protein